MQKKISYFTSITKNIPIKNPLNISKKIIVKEGALLAAEVLENKEIYNQIELHTGDFTTLKKGDTLIVALGRRKALRGFVGDIPKKIKSGDIIHLLNIGGVSGICTSENLSDVGKALPIKILGSVMGANNKPQFVKDGRQFKSANHFDKKIPKLLIVTGTCMNVGKTTVIHEMVKSGKKMGLKVACAKVTGVAALRDTKKMDAAGAIKTVSIVDAGYTSSILKKEKVIKIIKGSINYLAANKPDIIIIEFGDGILGEYNVFEVLSDKELKQHIWRHVACAYDPPGAMKLVEIYKKMKIRLDLISGPVTDNSVGVEFIKKKLKHNALNSFSDGSKILPSLL